MFGLRIRKPRCIGDYPLPDFPKPAGTVLVPFLPAGLLLRSLGMIQSQMPEQVFRSARRVIIQQVRKPQEHHAQIQVAVSQRQQIKQFAQAFSMAFTHTDQSLPVDSLPGQRVRPFVGKLLADASAVIFPYIFAEHFLCHSTALMVRHFISGILAEIFQPLLCIIACRQLGFQLLPLIIGDAHPDIMAACRHDKHCRFFGRQIVLLIAQQTDHPFAHACKMGSVVKCECRKETDHVF